MTPVLSLSDVMKSDILRAIRETAIFNLSRSDDIPRPRRPSQSKSDDPLSPHKIIDAIVKSMSAQDPSGLEKYAVVTDRTTETDPYILTACGCLSLLSQQSQTAETFFVKAVEENPDCEIAWLCLIWSYMASAEWDQGLSTLRKVVRRFPASESVGMFAMSLHLKSGSPILAWTWISQGDIDCMFVRHERGVASLMDGDLAEASADFQVVIQRALDRCLLGSANINLGHCFRRAGEFDKAIECYQNSLTYGVRESEALASIGFTYHLIGDFDQAIFYYNTCLSTDPVHAFATKMLEIALQTRLRE
jgi:anaphase-promoting complex subunit 6